ncbi:hypothetical protein [Salinactinospora qingdaonensis]|uniref:DUF8083 domain-containing protein n=1 Tax=Salinactinospora qingdaonensis TaxID=702744 RepID=A0ABP7F306_9ACTN
MSVAANDICHDAIVLPYTAYLRVYQPISAFSGPDQAYWRDYVESSRRPRRAGAVAAEHAESLRRLVASPPIVAPEYESGDAYVRRVGTELFICPWQTRLRSLLAFEDFYVSTAAKLRTAFMPESVAESTEEALERRRERGEPMQPQILTSSWTVPLPWFAAFDAEERCLVLNTTTETVNWEEAVSSTQSTPGEPELVDLGRHPDATPIPKRALLYVTEVERARERLERTISVLRATMDESAALVATERLDDWLAGVGAHPRGLLELDYGGLVHLLSNDELREDQSVAEVKAAVSGLESGEREVTLAMYRRLNARWKAVQELEHAN